MSIRFKFRSSVNFDTVEIDGGKQSISVGELRSKILNLKKLNNIAHKDFHLVFSDALTSQEYNDDKFEIPSGSSVIIKRVPMEMVPSAMLGHQKLEASELSEDAPKGSDRIKQEEVVLEKKIEQKSEDHIRLEKLARDNCVDLQSAGLPSELKCPLCNTYFKEAVMVPCCHHSFCEKCIHEVLVTEARCPRCSSSKCRVEHLLPNLCLRRAIEHFLESQILGAAPEKDLQKYVPDGESGIQGNEVSCAAPVSKRRLDLHNSTSATEKGSNQYMAESVYDSQNMKNAFMEGTGYHIGNLNAVGVRKSTPLFKVKYSDGDRSRPEDLAPVADSQGENQPVNIPQSRLPDEADSPSRKRGLWVDPGGEDRNPAVGNRNKADRACYMCGSPDHFIRDCPIASNQRPMFHTGERMVQGGMPGYGTSYWTGAAAFPPVTPYMNMYGSPGMVPFNPNMVPVSPYGVPHYIPAMYGGLPLPGGNMRIGGFAPPVLSGVEGPFTHPEALGFKNTNHRRNGLEEKRERPSDLEDDHCHKRRRCDELQREPQDKSHRERGKNLSNSDESHDRMSRRNHHGDRHLDHNIQFVDQRYDKLSYSTNAGRDRRSYHTDRSASGVEDLHNSSDRFDEVRHKEHYRSSGGRRERREQSGSDSSWSRHQMKKERGMKRRSGSEIEDIQHKRNSCLSSGPEPSSSGDQKKRCRDRWQMVSGSGEDYIKSHHHHKRK